MVFFNMRQKLRKRVNQRTKIIVDNFKKVAYKQMNQVDECDKNRIKIFEVSPNAKFIAANIGNSIYLKILNQTDKN